MGRCHFCTISALLADPSIRQLSIGSMTLSHHSYLLPRSVLGCTVRRKMTHRSVWVDPATLVLLLLGRLVTWYTTTCNNFRCAFIVRVSIVRWEGFGHVFRVIVALTNHHRVVNLAIFSVALRSGVQLAHIQNSWLEAWKWITLVLVVFVVQALLPFVPEVFPYVLVLKLLTNIADGLV